MPGTNLTRDEARTRAELLDVESYAVDLDLDPARTTTFGSTTVIRFRSRDRGRVDLRRPGRRDDPRGDA